VTGRMPAPREPLDASPFRFAIVVAAFNQDVTGPLLEGALSAFAEAGAPDGSVAVHHVPGAFELPLACRTLAETKRFDAVVALGCVIRGDTPHFDYVAGEAARGIMAASLETGVPIAFGVLTTDDRAQADARAGGEHGNKGADSARVAIEMAALLRGLRSDG
jgi:6,7-dimethyl-8-ribityllumazine synthase